MTDLDKARALVALRSGITHGNWRYEPSCDGWSAGVSAEDGRAVVWTSDKLHHGVDNPHDAKAMAAVPELLETITSLIADVERYRAAQADYERRILSAIDHPAPAPVSDETREDVKEVITEIIGETHDMDVRDEHYAENIVSWLERHYPAAWRALSQTGDE